MARKKSKSQKKISRAMREVHKNPPRTVKAKGKTARRKQMIAIGLAKARKAGARIPKKRGR